MEIKEIDINWNAFLQGCLEKDDELIRVYWYQAQKLSNPNITLDKAQRIIERQNPGKTPTEINALANDLVKKAQAWAQEQTKRYDRQLHRYDEMSINYPVIEMARKGLIKIDPFKETYLGEKGLDVALAVNMIKFHDKCDKIILISGDLDYAEAIQFIKDNLKTVHIVRLFRGYPPVNRNISRTLLALADKVIDLYESDISKRIL